MNPIEDFLQNVTICLDFAVKEGFADPKQMGVGGLSRGGFMAAHAASRDERFRFLLVFAPLTKLSILKEFRSMQDHPVVSGFDLQHLAPRLFQKHNRFYIGNHDTRVSTRACFETVMAISEEAHKHHIRSPQVECIISPSIGRDGHGTSFETFKHGALWISECLNK
ncbi:MAG: hypothetical protein FJZ64_00965 [Chlamydiae bacterium]|nr:hypothetical protein [Chlamydiota bacterium]